MLKALSAYNVNYLKITFEQSEFSPHAYVTQYNHKHWKLMSPLPPHSMHSLDGNNL